MVKNEGAGGGIGCANIEPATGRKVPVSFLQHESARNGRTSRRRGRGPQCEDEIENLE